MKITAFLLLVACLHLSARGLSQGKITLNAKAASLESILKDIRKQTGYQYLFVDQWEQEAKKIDISVSNATLEEVLDLCFKDQPFSYTIIKKMIVVKKKEESKSPSVNPPAPLNFKGRVTNEQGEPLAGASVTVKNGKKGTLTDEKGMFELKNVPADAVLMVSYTGYQNKEIPINGEISLTIILGIAKSILDQVQVIAYGTTTERLSTGNVTTVKAGDIEKQPVSNPLLALEGRVPGLQITQSTGLPGTAVTVQIRGKNSIQNGNDPLYIIDGVPYSSQLLPNLNINLGTSVTGQNLPVNSGNPFSYLNPADIESIDVLKDADATAIYGSRAANGAILITTKKGKTGHTYTNINFHDGWGKVPHTLALLNTQQYLQMRHEAIANDNAAVSARDYDINGVWDTTRYTDWQKVLIGGTAHITDLQGSVSGGTSNTSFIIGAGYHKETTVYPGNFSDQKGSLHFNIVNLSPDGKFRVQLGGNYLVDLNQMPRTELTNIAINLAPDAPPIYNTDGTLNWALPNPNVFGRGSWSNPIASLNQKIKGHTYNLLSNSLISYQLFPGLLIKVSLGYTNMQVREVQITPASYFDPYVISIAGNSIRSASYANNSISSWIVEPQITYMHNAGKGKLEILAGSTIQRNYRIGEIINGSGYNSDLVLDDIRSAATTSINYTENSLYKYAALFGRMNYNLQDKLLLNLSGRRDGSSRFGSANQFHNFWAVGVGWIFSNEQFFRSKIPFLSFGKLRGSYGTTGNDQIANYQFLDIYNSTSYEVPYQGINGLSVGNLYNPYLQWEETRKWEGGLELGFMKDRILISSSYFRNRSSNQLLFYAIPYLTGFSGITKNLPATVQNSGVEFLFNVTNIKSKSFRWASSINLTIPRNKLIAFPGIENSSYFSSFIIGQPITIQKLYHAVGVDPTTGVYKFASKTDPFNPVYPDDATTLVNTAPKYYGGFLNTFSYKRFEFSILFNFVKQTGANYLYGYLPGYFNHNQPITVLNRWQKAGDVSTIQQFTSSRGTSVYTAYNNANSSDLTYQDASFIRLQNLFLSWQLAEAWKKKAHLQNCSIYIQGQNLLTITHYKGLDPESQSSLTLPPLRVLVIGLQTTL